MASWGPLGPQEAAQEPGWASHFGSPNHQKSIKKSMPKCIQILDPFLYRFWISSRFFDVDFALLGKRFSVFCVSIVILRRSHFSRRTLGFLEGICFRAFARRQVKWLWNASKIVLEIDIKSMKIHPKIRSKTVVSACRWLPKVSEQDTFRTEYRHFLCAIKKINDEKDIQKAWGSDKFLVNS